MRTEPELLDIRLDRLAHVLDVIMPNCANLVRDALELLKEQPELIRCKDCKYCEYPDAEREWCKKGHLHGNAKTWFCADGVAKDINVPDKEGR